MSGLKADCDMLDKSVRGINSFRGKDFGATALVSLNTCAMLTTLEGRVFHASMSMFNPSVMRHSKDILGPVADDLKALKTKVQQVTVIASNLMTIAAGADATKKGFSSGGNTHPWISSFPSIVNYSSMKGYWTYAYKTSTYNKPSTKKRPLFGLYYCMEFSDVDMVYEDITNPVDTKLPKDNITVYDYEGIDPSSGSFDDRCGYQLFKGKGHKTVWFEFIPDNSQVSSKKPTQLKVGESYGRQIVAPIMTNIYVSDMVSQYGLPKHVLTSIASRAKIHPKSNRPVTPKYSHKFSTV